MRLRDCRCRERQHEPDRTGLIPGHAPVAERQTRTAQARVSTDVRVRVSPGVRGVVPAHPGGHARRLAVGWAPEAPEHQETGARTAAWMVNR